jgi:hypothetical protein
MNHLIEQLDHRLDLGSISLVCDAPTESLHPVMVDVSDGDNTKLGLLAGAEANKTPEPFPDCCELGISLGHLFFLEPLALRFSSLTSRPS